MKFSETLQLNPLFRTVVALVLGILAGEAWGGYLPLWVSFMAAGVFGFAAVVSDHRLFRNPHVASVFVYTALFFFGMYLFATHQKAEENPFPSDPVGYEAVLFSEPREYGKTIRCDMIITSVPRPVQVRASILRDTVSHRYRQLHIGDGIRAYSVVEEVRSYHPSPATQSQKQTFIFYRNWQKAPVSLATLPMVKRAQLRLLQFRNKLLSTIPSTDKADQAAAVVAAMTLGDKSSISHDTRDIYSISGASHVLALSGLHLGIIYFVMSFVFVRLRWRVVGQMITLPALWMFALMVGFSPSVIRAATMLTVYGLVSMFGRRSLSLNTLSLAALVMLLVRPQNLWDVGFQLSFMAVTGIILFYRPIYNLLVHGHKSVEERFLMDSRHPGILRRLLSGTWQWVVGLAVVSVATQVMVAPLVAYYFGRFSCYFLLTNFIAIPLVTLILYAGVCFFISIPMPSVQLFLGHMILRLARWLNAGLTWVASLPGASIEGIHLNRLQVLFIYLLIAIVSAFIYRLYDIYRRNRLYQQR